MKGHTRMLGKTHMVVGIAAALTITQPATIPELILSIGGGSFGALISDIDSGTSDSHRDADRITLLTGAIVAGALAMDYFFHAGIVDRILQNSGYEHIIIGVLLFIGICAFGKEQPHRSFMHSFLALVLLSSALSLILEKAVIYFSIGFLSHLILDVFNKRKLKLFYPSKKGIAFKLCSANGIVNTLLFKIGSSVCIINLVISIIKILQSSL